MTTLQSMDQSQVEALQALVISPELERLEDLLAEFNPFDVLGIEKREVRHSKFLAWLLDPRGSHGLRDYFLRRFLTQAAAGIVDITPLDVDSWKLNDVEVATERHNIDILILSENDGFICLIENKIGGGEGADQLSRYVKTVEREYEGFIPLPIFLTPDGREPDNEKDAESWASFGYQEIADLIDRTLETRGSTISAGVAGFLEQYARTIRRHVLDTADNIDELALQIYNNHPTAIDRIITAKSKVISGLQAEGWGIIDAAVEKYASSLKPDFHAKLYHRFYSPELDDIPDLKEGNDWTDSGRILLFQLNYREGSVTLVIGPGPDEARQLVYDLVQSERVGGVDMSRKKALSRKWHTVYSKRLVRKTRGADPDYEKSQTQVEQAIDDFHKNDYWPIVNAIRGEFKLSPVSH